MAQFNHTKIVQAEYNGKKKPIFFLAIVKAPPIFAAGNDNTR